GTDWRLVGQGPGTAPWHHRSAEISAARTPADPPRASGDPISSASPAPGLRRGCRHRPPLGATGGPRGPTSAGRRSLSLEPVRSNHPPATPSRRTRCNRGTIPDSTDRIPDRGIPGRHHFGIGNPGIDPAGSYRHLIAAVDDLIQPAHPPPQVVVGVEILLLCCTHPDPDQQCRAIVAEG